MKQLLLFVLFIPTLLWAQDDSKYLAGAVPQENGKVIFTKEISAPALSSKQIYDSMLQWAKGRFNTNNARVVYASEAEGDIAAVGEEYLVFQNSALSLDRTLMNYRVTIECKNHDCTIKVNGIRYEYNVSYQREPEKYLAEEWISDKYALNKDKTKLYKGNGKFRTKTVDFVNDLFKDATATLGIQAVAAAPAAQPVTAVAPVSAVPATSVVATTTQKEGYVAFSSDKVPSTLIQMLPESNMQVNPDKNQTVKEQAATWKGIGNMFGKSIASVSIHPDSPAYKAVGNNDIYNLSFFKKGETGDAWLIIECRKVGEADDSGQKTLMGEVLNVWVK